MITSPRRLPTERPLPRRSPVPGAQRPHRAFGAPLGAPAPAQARAPFAALPRRALAHVPQAMASLMLTALAAAAAYQLAIGTQSPGQEIRSELSAAAVAVGAMAANAPAEKISQTVERYFHGRKVAVDTTKFPTAVAVTVDDLDRPACLAARADARRIARLVVVELEGYGAPGDCRDRNAMTWRILP
jgi:hypothetical protein